MFVLRYTKKILDRIRPVVPEIIPRSTTGLGDWYATLLFTRPTQLVLLVSEASRLPILMPARELSSLAERLPNAVGSVLKALKLPDKLIARELAEMSEVVFAPTASRSLLGSLNDFAFMAKWALEREPHLTHDALSLELAGTPVSPLNGRRPADIVGGGVLAGLPDHDVRRMR